MKINVPKGEKLVLTVFNNIENEDISYIITTGIFDNTWYWRYNYIDEKFVKDKKAHIPTELY